MFGFGSQDASGNPPSVVMQASSDTARERG